MTEHPTPINRADHDAEVGSLKRKIERLRGELACYREFYPGWTYNHELQCLYSTGDHEPCLEGE